MMPNNPSEFVIETMAKHHPDLIMCRKQPGIAIGRLCEKCGGKCVICDSYVHPFILVRVCDECNCGSFQGRCVICGGVGISDAYGQVKPAGFFFFFNHPFWGFHFISSTHISSRHTLPPLTVDRHWQRLSDISSAR
ncbi:PHF5-like [Trema orientale]|uniref:PHF5-like n=1 Tax=Trema orientale TaxID=63057 RepID=A0A2P5ELI4_TREOI|nr:PHF5-like [Trema orientale]